MELFSHIPFVQVVSTLTWAASSFVARELVNSCARLARHRYACRIFCRLQEFCGNRRGRGWKGGEDLDGIEDL